MTFLKLTIFLNDIELFRLATANPASSQQILFPCIIWEPDGEWIYEGCKCGNKLDHIPGAACESIWKYTGKGGRYYISKNYPIWTQELREQTVSIMGQDWMDNIDKEKEEFENGWNIFIQQLKKEGKYRE